MSHVAAELGAVARRIDDNWEHLINKLHQSGSSQQEEPVTTPAQPTVSDNLHGLANAIDGNPLIRRLLRYGIGRTLTEQEADVYAHTIDDAERYRAIQQHQQPVTAEQISEHQPVTEQLAQFPPAQPS